MSLRRRNLLIASLGLAPLRAAGSTWLDRKPAEWTPRDIQTVLNESPWVRQVPLLLDRAAMSGQRADKETRRVATEFSVTVRWESGLPVRLARRRAAPNDPPMSEYIVTVSRLPLAFIGSVSGRPKAATDDKAMRSEVASLFSQSAILERAGAAPIAATGAIWVETGFTPGILISFPRKPIVLEDGEAQFTARAHALSVSARFELKPMVYRGRLEL